MERGMQMNKGWNKKVDGWKAKTREKEMNKEQFSGFCTESVKQFPPVKQDDGG